MGTHNTRNNNFDLAFRECDGRLAVWYKSPSGRDYLVDPLVFFNAIVDSKETKSFLLHSRKLLWYSTERIRTHLIFNNGACIFLIEDFSQGNTEVQKTSIKKFWQQAKSSFTALHRALKDNVKTYYANEVKLEDLDVIVQQFDMAELCIRYYAPFTSDVSAGRLCLNFERFILKSTGYSEIVYHASIGDVSFTGAYDGDYENIETIRHRLEDYICNYETRFSLKYAKGSRGYVFLLDDFATIEMATPKDGQRGVKVDILTKVIAKPITLSKGPAIIGLGNPRQVVREIYEALLDVGRRGFYYRKDGDKNEWYASPMTFYNKMKSNIIEDYTNGFRTPYEEAQKRQTIIKHVYTICPDYGRVLFYDEEGVCSGADEDDTVKFDEENPNSIVMATGIYAWQMEFETKTDGVKSTMGTLDSREWNQRGLILAQQLRQQLPDEYDLWYMYPFEDAENRDKRAILLYKK